MLNWLTRTRRRAAGRLIALAYLFCVLAPAMSFAFADGARAAPCLTESEHGLGVVHVHDHGVLAQSVHEDDDDAHHHHSLSEASESKNAVVGNADPETPSKDHHKSSGGQCCGMMCVTALPAAIAEFGRPDTPQSVCVSANIPAVVEEAPPQLYRPPIA